MFTSRWFSTVFFFSHLAGENGRLERNEIGAIQSGKAGESPALITAGETGSVCHIFSTVIDRGKHSRAGEP